MKRWMSIFIIAAMVVASVTATDCAVVQGKKISGYSAAKKAALKKVPSAQVTEVDTDMENGVLVYDVELHKKNKEYTLKYRASDGKLLEYGWDIIYPAQTNQNRKSLSRKKIRKKALKQVKKAAVVSLRKQYDDGIEEYKIKLTKGSRRYELVYDSKSGKLLEYEWELQAVKKTSASTSNSKYIGVKKAKKIALKKAPNATVTKVKFERDDGMAVYEVDMIEGMYEYEVEINAKTGSIIKFDKEIDD